MCAISQAEQQCGIGLALPTSDEPAFRVPADADTPSFCAAETQASRGQRPLPGDATTSNRIVDRVAIDVAQSHEVMTLYGEPCDLILPEYETLKRLDFRLRLELSPADVRHLGAA